MAIDTENKRRTAPGFLFLVVAPVADNSVDPVDRPHAAFVYSGFFGTEGGTRRQRQMKSLIKSRRRRR